MSESESQSGLVLELAEEFLDRYRNGERPSLREYLQRYPELAAEIKDVFPTMALMENIAVVDDSLGDQAQGQPALGIQAKLQQLGDFRIIREIGHGGMGVVYEAEQVSLGRHVALKVLPQTLLANARSKQRFEREAKAAAKLHHTNIVPVFGVGEHEGLPYYVMQFIPGLGLDVVLKELQRLHAGKPGTGNFPGRTDGELRVSHRDVSVAVVAQSLLTGHCTPVGAGADLAPAALTDATAALGPSADASAHRAEPAGPPSKTPVAGRLSDTFSLSSSAMLPGTGRQPGGKQLTYWRSVAKIGLQVADALHYAHCQGIQHRDIKPSNLLLDTAGTVWVTDFGLAKADDHQNLTDTGDIVGTLRYMPPEAFEGKADARGDVYALGLTLYELLAFRPGFNERDRVKLIKQVTSTEPVRLGKVNRQVPRDLATIVHKAIERDPRRRYSSAGELAADLRRFEEDRPVHARRVTGAERLWRWCRRNPTVAALMGAVAGMLFLGTTVAMFFAVRAEEARRAEASARRAVEQTLADSYTASGIQATDVGKPAESLIWFAAAGQRSVDDPVRQRDNDIRFWSWARNLPIPVRALQIAGFAQSLVFHPAGRFALARVHGGKYALWDLTDERPEPFPDGAATVSAAAWNRDGTRLATGTPGGRVGIYRFPQGERLADFQHPGAISALAFDEGGKRLAVASDCLRIWDCERATFVTPAYAHPAGVAEIVFSQSGDRVATSCADRLCRVWPVPGDAKQSSPSFAPVPHLLSDESGWPGHPSAPVFLDRDRGLLTRCENARVAWIDTATGATVRTIRPASNYLGWIAASPNRDYFALGSFSSVQLYDSANGNPVGNPMSHGNYVYTGSFHPDGKSLLTASADRTARLWSVPTGKPLSSPLQHQDEVVAAVFLPQGTCFATAQKDDLMRIWKQQPLWKSLPTGGTEGYVQLAPDCRHAMAAGFNGSRSISAPRVFDLAMGQPAGPPLDIGGGLVNNAAFAPEGQRVAVLTSLPEHGKQRDPHLRLREQAGRLHFFDWSDGRRLLEPLPTPTEPIGAAYSPNGKRLVVVCAGGEVLILDPATGRNLRQANHPARYQPGFFLRDFVRFFADGSRFVTWGLGNEARVWDAESGQFVYALSSGSNFVSDVRLAPDGKLLATASLDKTVTVFDAATGQAVAAPLRHSDWVFTLRFSPDGKHIATASRDHMARIWDWRTSKLTCPPMAHQDELFDVCYACDGRFILTAGKDGTSRLWDSALGKPMSPPLAMRELCYRVAVTPDNAHVVVAGRIPNLLVCRLPDLVEPGPSPKGGLQALAEVISGLSLHPGGGIANLTTDEWHERWTNFRDRNPDYSPFAYSP